MELPQGRDRVPAGPTQLQGSSQESVSLEGRQHGVAPQSPDIAASWTPKRQEFLGRNKHTLQPRKSVGVVRLGPPDALDMESGCWLSPLVLGWLWVTKGFRHKKQPPA